MNNIFHDIYQKSFFFIKYGIPVLFNNTSRISRHELNRLVS